MSNPATQVITPTATATSNHQGSLQAPVTARYPPTGAMARLTPSQRCGHQVNRLDRLYAMIQPSASGLSRKQRGLISQAVARKRNEASTTETQACRTVIAPRGSSRVAVRGFRASNSRSTIRLNPIATQRADEKATTTSATNRQVTGCVNEAASTPSRANGSAKRVCGSFTKLA